MAFKPGDVVVLKSGGPHMTVQSVTSEKVVCEWYESGDFKWHTFLEVMVRAIKMPTFETE